MPEKLEKQLRQEAIKKRLHGKRANAYIYGTLRKTGWRPSQEMQQTQGTQGTGSNGNNNS